MLGKKEVEVLNGRKTKPDPTFRRSAEERSAIESRLDSRSESLSPFVASRSESLSSLRPP